MPFPPELSIARREIWIFFWTRKRRPGFCTRNRHDFNNASLVGECTFRRKIAVWKPLFTASRVFYSVRLQKRKEK